MKSFLYIRANIKLRRLTFWERITGKINENTIIDKFKINYIFHPSLSHADCFNRGRETINPLPGMSIVGDEAILLKEE